MSEVDLNDIGVFVQVVRSEGFTAAAKRLGLPTSAVSRRVARLEKRTGFKLLNRTTRSTSLTEAGRVFYARTADLQNQVEDALRAMSSLREAPGGRLRITAPPDHGGVIWALISDFLRHNSEVDVEITHTLDNVDLVQEGIDVALRGGPPPDSSEHSAHRLFESRILLAASPSYLERRGVPRVPEDLADHDGVCMDPWAPNAIRRLGGDGGFVRVSLRNRVRANSLHTAQRAAVAGFGVAPLLHLTCWRHLAEGRLVEVLRGALPDHADMWVVCPVGRTRSAAATAFVDSVRDTAARLEAEAPSATA